MIKLWSFGFRGAKCYERLSRWFWPGRAIHRTSRDEGGLGSYKARFVGKMMRIEEAVLFVKRGSGQVSEYTIMQKHA